MTSRLLLLAANLCFATAVCAGAVPAAKAPRGMAFGVYVRLEYGMTEGDLILRAGRPDHQSANDYREGLKRVYYAPTLGIPYLTTVTLRAGRIIDIKRERRAH